MSISSLKDMCLDAIAQSSSLRKRARQVLPRNLQEELSALWTFGIAPFLEAHQANTFFITKKSTNFSRIDSSVIHRVAKLIRERGILILPSLKDGHSPSQNRLVLDISPLQCMRNCLILTFFENHGAPITPTAHIFEIKIPSLERLNIIYDTPWSQLDFDDLKNVVLYIFNRIAVNPPEFFPIRDSWTSIHTSLIKNFEGSADPLEKQRISWLYPTRMHQIFNEARFAKSDKTAGQILFHPFLEN